MIHIQTSLFKIDKPDHILNRFELKKQNKELRKEIEALNARHIDHIQYIKKEIKVLNERKSKIKSYKRELQVLNARIKQDQNQLSVTPGN